MQVTKSSCGLGVVHGPLSCRCHGDHQSVRTRPWEVDLYKLGQNCPWQKLTQDSPHCIGSSSVLEGISFFFGLPIPEVLIGVLSS